MEFNFPEVDPGRDWPISHYIDHIREECKEFEEEEDFDKKVMELLDILHSAETLVRKFHNLNPAVDLDEAVRKVIRKVTLKGYYEVK